MRLKSIKLAGFKSFVDPVTVPFDGNMTAIVGPNGCGKSNVIDAVRWVMGESSAKTLRGESMTDVIFNGSTGRAPIGQASIELLFDNSDGGLGGAWSGYREIAVKRLVTREPQSSYFLNGQKCRRRDIADIFLGTGLGPRSYAIIGQGMISRLVEARPEELRNTLEEAAGISKYKERRRETENRLRRTQENLERLDDICEELDKQLERLKRQAEAARRYRGLKDDEHRLRGELALLRERALRSQQHEAASRVRDDETQVEREVLGLRQCETRLAEGRESHDQVAAALEQHQAAFYQTGADIARLEQSLEHARQRQQQLGADLETARGERESLFRLAGEDDESLDALAERLETLVPDVELADEALLDLEASLEEAQAHAQTTQRQWEAFSETSRETRHRAEREQEAIERLEQELMSLRQEVDRLQRQQSELPDMRELRESREGVAESLEVLDERQQTLEIRREARLDAREQARSRLDERERTRQALQERRHRCQGEIASLEALIDAALDDGDAGVAEQLAGHALSSAPLLAEQLEVDRGWERVVGWVLGNWLNARLAEPETARAPLGSLASGELPVLSPHQRETTVVTDSLLTHVRGAGSADGVLNRIYCAVDEPEAWGRVSALGPGESVMTSDGLWLGQGWARRLGREEIASDGVLGQRQRREALLAEVAEIDERVAEIEGELTDFHQALDANESGLEALRQEELDLSRERQQHSTRLATLDSQLGHVGGRARELVEEIAARHETLEARTMALENARERWQQALAAVDDSQTLRESHEQQRQASLERVTTLRQQQQQAQAQQQALALERQRLQTQRDALEQQRERSREQLSRLEARCEALIEQRETLAEPDDDQRERLELLLETRSQQETTLNACRDRANQLGEALRQTELERQAHERELDVVRQRLQEGRMQVQALTLKADAQQEQLDEQGHDVERLLAGLDPDATESAWQTRLEETAERIRRLGAINLAAIEEYDQQAERRDYLEGQHAELSEAIETLERAIRRIDQETRTRFKQTFDEVNQGLMALFPRVFGGGAAWLTLTGEDLLETGVAIMARPPGKKNSTIHLLSGGEKALTALSLVFAIFQLNPAPFCMLDEVDAPLDDANVGRYAKLVKEMSESVQFIFITHNKIAMEAAERLMGVTMQEPGVSRLVSVGVDEAASMAETS
ncbi:chromosome segregation protein SMC [Salinicola rhizosphaerae]|uniref:Chromosome partition protein Smc n=1 Tax=Salinicola rhizosphaerae TaxID=1443141 RepID=A0ABQ3E023_9GAMM|nr:chromosome segregation protein SMC [Salinicola rhizosphaerae]GHB20742.1 chromosome partition protein Smc [Salinicola rhizosphaerae]